MTYGQQNDHCSLKRHNKFNIHITNDFVKAAKDLCIVHHHQNQEIRHMKLSYDISRFLNSSWSYQNVMSNTSIEASANYKLYLKCSEYQLRNHIIRIIKKTNSEKSWCLKIIRIKFRGRFDSWKLTLSTMKQITRSHPIDCMKIYALSQKWNQILIKGVSGT